MVDAAIDDSWCLKMSVLITVPSLDKGFGCRLLLAETLPRKWLIYRVPHGFTGDPRRMALSLE